MDVLLYRRVKVDVSVNISALCRCIPGYAGEGQNCTKCEAGSFSNDIVGTSQCHRCGVGSNSPAGARGCGCIEGYFNDTDGICQRNCVKGSFLNESGICQPCPAGQYGDIQPKDLGKAICKECGADLNSTEGSSGEDACYCTKGFIKNSNKLKCEKCAEGIDCDSPVMNRSMVRTQQGFYLLKDTNDTETTTYAAGRTELPVLISCPFKKACLSTDDDTGLTKCAEGHHGFVCGLCEDGYASQGPLQPCLQCASLGVNILAAAALVSVTFALVFILTSLAQSSGARPRDDVQAVLCKLTLNHVTSISVLAMLVFSMSHDDERFSVWVKSSSRPFTWDGGLPLAYTSWDCLIRLVRDDMRDTAVLWRHAVWIVIPLLCLIVMPIIAALFAWGAGCVKRCCPQSVTERAPLRQDTIHIWTGSVADWCGKVKKAVDQQAELLIVILTFTHPTVTRNMLMLLRCRPYPSLDEANTRFGFLYQDAAFALRRVLVLLVAHMAVGNPGFQLVGWSIIAVICLHVHMLVKPFDHRHMDLLNRVEARGLLTWLVSIMLLSVIIHGETNDYVSATLLLLAMMLNLYHYLILVWLICHNGLCDLAETKEKPSTRSPARRTTFGWLTATSWRRCLQPICRPAAGCLSHFLAWHTRRAEKQRGAYGKVFLDWESGKLSWTEEGGDNVTSSRGLYSPRRRRRYGGVADFLRTLWHGRSSEWRLARRSALMLRMLSAAVEEATDRLQIRDVPLDFLDFLLCWAFYLTSPYMKKQCRLRWESTVSSDRQYEVRRRSARGGSQGHPTNNGLRSDSTAQERR
ncbi:unnamed protein product [Vitrella brassicaformis CCMP3155]|uniref:Tyrosine-protein kinase ephrin type A/B receptor-like domain-containing protein n=1 Tax=Vitrella brassicaformis (strain CCMP3155) TaxID=1169540 RepID=A0A0G4FUY4_VITBC|nr:unnamed protein product [Vitrella brassicaformis CCMP3155]|eukprot:CEM18772.1 unnamed protein product [Vitrella brassicaformis CCMP3155]